MEFSLVFESGQDGCTRRVTIESVLWKATVRASTFEREIVSKSDGIDRDTSRDRNANRGTVRWGARSPTRGLSSRSASSAAPRPASSTTSANKKSKSSTAHPRERAREREGCRRSRGPLRSERERERASAGGFGVPAAAAPPRDRRVRPARRETSQLARQFIYSFIPC